VRPFGSKWPESTLNRVSQVGQVIIIESMYGAESHLYSLVNWATSPALLWTADRHYANVC